MHQWVADHVVLLSAISGLTFVTGIVGAVAVAVVLPEDYFTKPQEHRHGMGTARKVLKNGVGVMALLVGFLMSLPLVPGPGVIIMLVGLSMTDFPGKRKLEVRLLRFPALLTQLNGIRAKFNRPPLKLPQTTDASKSTRPSESRPTL